MSALLQYNLVAHIIFGLLGIMALYATWMVLLRDKLNLRFARWSSTTAVVSLVLSWLSGGYYYTMYYGTTVKPIIKDGAYPWAHSVFMEAKEHVFLFLPFLAIVIAASVFLLGDRLTPESKFKRPLVFVTGLSFILGVAITLSGVLISGAVR